MWHDVFARNNQFTVMFRVTKDFRPIQAFVSYWTAAGFGPGTPGAAEIRRKAPSVQPCATKGYAATMLRCTMTSRFN